MAGPPTPPPSVKKEKKGKAKFEGAEDPSTSGAEKDHTTSVETQKAEDETLPRIKQEAEENTSVDQSVPAYPTTPAIMALLSPETQISPSTDPGIFSDIPFDDLVALAATPLQRRVAVALLPNPTKQSKTVVIAGLDSSSRLKFHAVKRDAIGVRVKGKNTGRAYVATTYQKIKKEGGVWLGLFQGLKEHEMRAWFKEYTQGLDFGYGIWGWADLSE